MNEHHARLCPTPEWAEHIRDDILPWLLANAELGNDMLELGPGPGASTEWLRHKVKRLVAVEQEPEAVEKLVQRYRGGNIEVTEGDATALEYADESFDSAGCFTMLHHVPTLALQNRLFAEVLRVLRPGGVFIGSDSLGSDRLHQFHEADTYNPIEPATLLTRLQTIGYAQITVRVDYGLRFVAQKAATD
jgi:SAM-dependent methyltransferase